MRQVLQNLKSGETFLLDVPKPALGRGEVLIRSARSVISAGTERMLVDFGKAGLVGKAMQQPEKVRQVLNKVKTDGAVATFDAVAGKLNEPLPMGYSNAGVVVELGADVNELAVGDRVVSNGHHAELVRVPRNLVSRIPDGVSDESAAFTVIGSIALQAVRLLNPTLGERVGVIGLGIVGLMAAQILRANGCRVFATDFSDARCDIARAFGCQAMTVNEQSDPSDAARAFSNGYGLDGVIIATATDSRGPVSSAARMCRKRGRIVLVGTADLSLSRDEFYHKELTFQVSCSYGPGRYEKNYEKKGLDYPIGFVRWTEQRNMEAVLDLMQDGSIDPSVLVSSRYSLDDVEKAYDELTNSSSLGIVLEYPESVPMQTTVKTAVNSGTRPAGGDRCVMAFAGAGGYASRILIPAFKQADVTLHTVVSAGGTTASFHGRQAGFLYGTTDYATVLENPEIQAVAICTPHNRHADMVVDALKHGKHVFVEKPLAIRLEELEEIRDVYETLPEANRPILMVGYNRRFSPLAKSLKEAVSRDKSPVAVAYLCNAGEIQGDHWTQDPLVGGGRIIGEACHFIDFSMYVAGSSIVNATAVRMPSPHGEETPPDSAAMNLEFKNGSIASINYLANGTKAFQKERVEVFHGGSITQLNNFRSLKSYLSSGRSRSRSLFRQDKGQTDCAAAFVDAVINGKPSPISFEELYESTYWSIRLAMSEP